MRKLIFLTFTAFILISCSNDPDNESEIVKNNFPKVSDIYLLNTNLLKQHTGIDLDLGKLNQDTYVQDLISSIAQLNDDSFSAVCHINYGSDGLVESYTIGSMGIHYGRFDHGGTIQRDAKGNVISINNIPVRVGNNKITFENDGWYKADGYPREVSFKGSRLTKTYFIDGMGKEIKSDSYTYVYNDDFVKKHKTGGNFSLYEVLEYHNDECNLPWIMSFSSLSLSLEIAFNLRLMKKIPKKIFAGQHKDQSADITHIIKDHLSRPVLIIGRNHEYTIDRIAVYQYAD